MVTTKVDPWIHGHDLLGQQYDLMVMVLPVAHQVRSLVTRNGRWRGNTRAYGTVFTTSHLK